LGYSCLSSPKFHASRSSDRGDATAFGLGGMHCLETKQRGSILDQIELSICGVQADSWEQTMPTSIWR
jgi:hypothetical protein